MKILKDFEIVDLGLYLKKHKTLIIGDIHIGYEEALNKKGVLVPRFQLKELLERLEKLVLKTKPSTIIINGDVKHEFGTISDQEWRDTLKVFDLLSKHADDIVLVKGNHDRIIEPIAAKRGIEVVDNVSLEDVYITHGDEIPESLGLQSSKTIIIGHEHPAIGLRKGQRIEMFKCFLVGKWQKKNLVVMPSFNLVVKGTDVLQDKLLSPFLTDISKFDVYISADKVYKFGKIEQLRVEF